MADYDVVVMGGGPGGYVAAIRAAQLGLRTAVVERDKVGGICSNWGCIPSKALIRNAEVLSLFRRASEFGIACDNLRFDYGAAVKRSRQVVERLVKGVEYLLKKNKVDLIAGEGYLRVPNKVEIKADGRVLEARNVVVATGAQPSSLPGLRPDGAHIITHHEALESTALPQAVVIVGGGPVGVEFAYVWRAYGVDVTIVEMLPHLLPNEDEEIGVLLGKAFEKQGIKVLTGAKVEEVAPPQGQGKARVRVSANGSVQQIEADKVLLGIGFRANTAGLGLTELGVRLERGFVKVDGQMRTSVPGVYAVGDVTGEALLAHVGFAQGTIAAETIAGRETVPLRYQDMPRCTYCQPQVASLGLTEQAARAQGQDVKVARFPFRANGKALTLGGEESEGLIKLVVDAKYGAILGACMIGHEVTEMLGELSLARALEATTAELALTVHAHPTLSEVIREVALVAEGQGLHI
ncbi:MAG: dihydrolipoyl dehydrogenase [Dehalococcoidia bacterium]|nr:dihydrolipoyl dehydrogenase [Dehalococcoidia bacterium]